jgi:hypothetical protein
LSQGRPVHAGANDIVRRETIMPIDQTRRRFFTALLGLPAAAVAVTALAKPAKAQWWGGRDDDRDDRGRGWNRNRRRRDDDDDDDRGRRRQRRRRRRDDDDD